MFYYVRVTLEFFKESFLVGPCYGAGQQQELRGYIEDNIKILCINSDILLENVELPEQDLKAVSRDEFYSKISLFEGD